MKRDRQRIVEYLIQIGMIYNAINIANLAFPVDNMAILKRLLAYSSAAAGGLYLGANTSLFINKVIDRLEEKFAKKYNDSNVGEDTETEKEVETNE